MEPFMEPSGWESRLKVLHFATGASNTPAQTVRSVLSAPCGTTRSEAIDVFSRPSRVG
jgi:hypothetical protein